MTPPGATFEAQIAGGLALWDVSDLLPRHAVKRRGRLRVTPELVVMHHTGADAPTIDGYQAAVMTATYHVRHTDWSRIGYHVHIARKADRDDEGRLVVYRTLPDALRPAATKGLNGRSWAIVLEGDLDEQPITEDQEEALEGLIPWYGDVTIIGHREAEAYGGKPARKSCPGRNGMRWLRRWRGRAEA